MHTDGNAEAFDPPKDGSHHPSIVAEDVLHGAISGASGAISQAGGMLERIESFALSDEGSHDSVLAIGIGATFAILGGAFCLCSRRRTEYRYSRELQAGADAEEMGQVRIWVPHLATESHRVKVSSAFMPRRCLLVPILMSFLLLFFCQMLETAITDDHVNGATWSQGDSCAFGRAQAATIPPGSELAQGTGAVSLLHQAAAASGVVVPPRPPRKATAPVIDYRF